MAVRFLPRGAKVADAAFPNANFPAALVEAGIEAFCGYLSIPTGNLKNWSPQRFAWFVDFPGVGHGMFCEQFETIVLQGYSAANLQLGRQCQDMADSFGVPDDVPMWFAVDTSPFGHFPEIAESFRAYKDTNRRPLGGYVGSQCGEYLMDLGLIDYLHVPSAVSWSECAGPANDSTIFAYAWNKQGQPTHWWYLSPRAHMLQHNSIDFAGSRIDPSDVLRDTPFWFPSETPPEPKAPTEEDDMPVYRINYGDIPGLFNGGVYELCCGTRRHVTSDEWHEVLKGVAQNTDGSWPTHELWQPTAAVANGWVLTGMPQYVEPTQGVAGPPGPQGPPGPAPHGTFPATLTL